MRPSNVLVANGGTTGTASFISSSVYSVDIVRCSFQITISSGSCVGTFAIQGSNDQAVGLPAYLFTPTNWNAIGSTSTVTCSSTPTSTVFLIPAFETSYEYMRVQFTAANGGAALGLANVRMKSLGL